MSHGERIGSCSLLHGHVVNLPDLVFCCLEFCWITIDNFLRGQLSCYHSNRFERASRIWIMILIFSVSGFKYLNVNNLLRNAIREMVVRGAPAIAIAAALSLAVEVFNLDFNGSATDSVSLLQKKLEYLVTRYFRFSAFLRQQSTYFD